MQIEKLCAFAATLVAIILPALGDTLTFVPQLDNGVTNYSWFSSGNWFSSDAGGNLIPAGRLPLINDTAIITGMADASSSGLRVQTLIATNNAVLTNGTYAIENLVMLSGSSFNQSAVNVLVTMTIAGTNCALNGVILTIFGTASGILQPATSLILGQGATLMDGGLLTLADGSRIIGTSPPQSSVVLGVGAILNATNMAALIGSPTNHLMIDNSGLIRADAGTLTFDAGIDWHSTAGAGEFRASNSNAILLFLTPFHVDAGVTDTFSGSGTNRWMAGGSVDGAGQVSGNLELLDSVSGGGNIEVLGTGSPGGVLSWGNGSLSLPAVWIDPGASMIFSGAPGSSRQLSGCTINNSGVCEVRTGGLGLIGGAIINNSVGGNFDIRADGSFSGTPGSAVNNAGTFLKTSSGATEFGTPASAQGPDFNNTCLVDVRSGQLSLLGGISSSEFRTESSAVLWFWGGTHTLTRGAAFTGAGTAQVKEGIGPSSWIVKGGLTASNVEVGANSRIYAATTNSILISQLLADSNGVLNNGSIVTENLQIRDQAVVTNSTLSVANSLAISGTNCSLQASTLILLPTGSGDLTPPVSATNCTLNLNQGSVFQIGGVLNLNDGALIAGGGLLPQNQLVVSPGATLVSSNQAVVQGAALNHLVIDNSGIIQADTGVLHFGSGLDWKSSMGFGEFKASLPASELSFASPFHSEAGSKSHFSGNGTSLWLSGGTLAGEAQVSGNLQVLGAVNGPGTIHVLGTGTTNGTLNWADGTLSLSGINIDANRKFLINPGPGNGCQMVGCIVENSGNCLWAGPGTITAGAGASFHNLPAGTLDLQTDVTLTSNTVPVLKLINDGLLRKSGGKGSSTLVADFTNDGIVDIQSGSLLFEGTWSQTLGSTTVDAGAVLGGSTLNVQGGILQGLGTIAAKVVNGGTVNPGNVAGILNIGPGAGYQQTAIGTLALEIGGGAPGSQYDQLVVGGGASLAGRLQLNLINGFAPKPGDRFEVLICSSQSGSFSTVDGSPVGDAFWVPQYTGTNVTVTLASAVSLSHPTISQGVLTLTFTTSTGLSYVVQTSGSLSPPNWQTFSTVPGNGSVVSVSDSTTNSQRYYRVLLQ